MSHAQMYLALMPLFLKVITANQSLRPAFITAQAYWLANASNKLVFRPGKQSTYPGLMRAAKLAASQEERLLLSQITTLGDRFLPIEP